MFAFWLLLSLYALSVFVEVTRASIAILLGAKIKYIKWRPHRRDGRFYVCRVQWVWDKPINRRLANASPLAALLPFLYLSINSSVSYALFLASAIVFVRELWSDLLGLPRSFSVIATISLVVMATLGLILVLL